MEEKEKIDFIIAAVMACLSVMPQILNDSVSIRNV